MTYEFSIWHDNKHSVELNFEVDESSDIYEFYDCCRAFAIAAGFTMDTVKKVFSEDI